MVRAPWYDIEMRGRRLESIFRGMNTRYRQQLEIGNYDLAFSFADRMLKTEAVMQPYIEVMTGVKKFINRSRKQRELENDINTISR
jgi:hypothetical protein